MDGIRKIIHVQDKQERPRDTTLGYLRYYGKEIRIRIVNRHKLKSVSQIVPVKIVTNYNSKIFMIMGGVNGVTSNVRIL